MKRREWSILLLGLILGAQVAGLVGDATAQLKDGEEITADPTAAAVRAEKVKLEAEWLAKSAAEVKIEIDKLAGSQEQKAAAAQVYVEKWTVEEHGRQSELLQSVLGISGEAAEAMITAQAVKFDGAGNPVFVTIKIGGADGDPEDGEGVTP